MVQPLLVSASAIRLATETVRSIMKIDDIVSLLARKGQALLIACNVLLFSFIQVNAK